MIGCLKSNRKLSEINEERTVQRSFIGQSRKVMRITCVFCHREFGTKAIDNHIIFCEKQMAKGKIIPLRYAPVKKHPKHLDMAQKPDTQYSFNETMDTKVQYSFRRKSIKVSDNIKNVKSRINTGLYEQAAEKSMIKEAFNSRPTNSFKTAIKRPTNSFKTAS